MGAGVGCCEIGFLDGRDVGADEVGFEVGALISCGGGN